MKKKITAIALSFFLIGSAVLANNMRVNLSGFHFIAPAVNGKANVYSPAVGEIVYDSSDAKFWGYDQTGTWVNLNGASGGPSVPVGTLIPYAGSGVPSGYLATDGSAVSRAAYPELFNIIGVTYGSGDGSTTFNLPDTRNVFLRGANANPRSVGSITYPAVTLGATVNDKFQGHRHPTDQTRPTQLLNVAAGTGMTMLGNGINVSINALDPISDGINSTPRTGSETAPVNLGMNFIIKY